MSSYPATASLPQSASIVSRWLLDEASGNRADSKASNTLTDVNTVAAGAGLVKVGANFNNSADFEEATAEELDGGDILDPAGGFTFSGWIKPETVSDGSIDRSIAIKYGSAGNRSYLFDLSGATSKLRLLVSGDGTNTVSISGSTTVATNTWIHVVGVYQTSTRLEIYINGVSDGTNTTSIPASIFNSTHAFRLGGRGTSFFDGLMQDVIFWNVALTDAEVLNLYNLYNTQNFIPKISII